MGGRTLTAMLYVLLEFVAKTNVMPIMQQSMYATVHQAYLGKGSWMLAMMEDINAMSHASCELVSLGCVLLLEAMREPYQTDRDCGQSKGIANNVAEINVASSSSLQHVVLL